MDRERIRQQADQSIRMVDDGREHSVTVEMGDLPPDASQSRPLQKGLDEPK